MPDLSYKNRAVEFWNKYERLFLGLITLAVLLLGGLLVVIGQWTNYNDSRKVWQDLQDKVATAKFQLSESQRNASQIVELSPEEKRLLNLVLPPSPDTPNMIVHFTSLAKRAGFNVNNLSFSENISNLASVKNSTGANAQTSAGLIGVQKVAVKMTLAGGDYNSFKLFLSLLEKSVIVSDVNSISFSGNGDSYDVSLVTYYRP